jgi:choline dehydrogenase-like flavoprotein
MIIDARRLSDTVDIRGSIAIIGGGAAGITLAIELADHFKDVLVLESGGTVFEKETQDLCDGKLLGHTQPDLRESRLRFLGGSTNHWDGLCPLLDPIDFERLPDRPYNGWPFGFATLIPFYNRAYRYCEIDAFRHGLPHVDATARRLFQGSELQLTEFRYSPRTKFGERYWSQVSTSERIRVYLNANVTGIVANDAKRAIQFLDVQTLNGRKLTVAAAAFVLCCGGIENARILLNCTRDFATGLGNQYDLVGRFFMDHLFANPGVIIPQIEVYDLGALDLLKGVTRDRVGLMNAAETVRQPGRRGCSLILSSVYDVDKVVVKAMQSPSYKAFRQIMQYAKRASLAPDLGEHGCTALEDPKAIARVLYHRLSTRFRPLPVQAIMVDMVGEQSPNPASRVTLSDDVDALGMRRVVLDWQIEPLDCSNLYQTAMDLARGVGTAGFGRMVLNLEPGVELSKVISCYHHMGTTRMHDDPRQGVVDRHCAVHGLSNFYIAGSSVFPTGGRANPTITIVALAIRLADHLKLTLK